MEDWVDRALTRWPNVPALFGWLGLDRRGRWLIRGETISRPQIVETINRNYAADEHGRWYFQNGPQRGYIALETAPLVLHTAGEGAALMTHTGLRVERPGAAYLDEEGSVLLLTEHGPGALTDTDLDWALQRITSSGAPVSEQALTQALALPSGATTALTLSLQGATLPLQRLDAALVPAQLGYVRDPQPREGERASTGEGPPPA